MINRKQSQARDETAKAGTASAARGDGRDAERRRKTLR